MKTAVEKLQSETAQQEAANTSMQKHLQDLRQNLSQKFAALPLPGMYVCCMDCLPSQFLPFSWYFMHSWIDLSSRYEVLKTKNIRHMSHM